VDGSLVAVTDGARHRIATYSIEGAFLGTIGLKGRGPAEFRRPLGVAIHRSRLYVTEGEGRRLQVLDLQGRQLQCIDMEGALSGICCSPFCCTHHTASTHGAYGAEGLEEEGPNVGRAPGRPVDTTTVAFVDHHARGVRLMSSAYGVSQPCKHETPSSVSGSSRPSTAVSRPSLGATRPMSHTPSLPAIDTLRLE